MEINSNVTLTQLQQTRSERRLEGRDLDKLRSWYGRCHYLVQLNSCDSTFTIFFEKSGL